MIETGALESALALHAAGSLADAEAAYRRIIDGVTGHAEAEHYLGVLLHQKGDSREGISLILRALEADGGSASRYNDLGNILVQTHDLASAAKAFQTSLQIDGDDVNVWNNLGSVLHRQQLYVAAENAYREALRCDFEFVPALNNLAALLAATEREEEASLYACRAFVQPPLTDKAPKMLGIAYYRLGRIAEAAECYRAWLGAEPGNEVARHFLAANTGEQVPPRASDDFVSAVFDEMAESFNEKLVNRLSYRGPEIIGNLLAEYAPKEQKLEVLDGGCGTGLCAPVLAVYARRLIGVDLSRGMLAKAKTCDLYHQLVNEELTTYLLSREDAFDLVVMADTMIYFGDLIALLTSVGQSLRPGGAVAFTAETAEQSAFAKFDYVLRPSGRYAHTRHFVEQALKSSGLTLLRCDEVVLRNEFCTPINGIGVLAQRPHE